MILSTKITIEELSKNSRHFKWDKYFCDKCHRYMWGHGYCLRYFSDILESVYLKRYRCPGCRKVVTIRPEGYWKYLRSSIRAIYEALRVRLTGFWPLGFPRQRGGHWLLRFGRLAQMENQECLPTFLEHCFSKQIHFLS